MMFINLISIIFDHKPTYIELNTHHLLLLLSLLRLLLLTATTYYYSPASFTTNMAFHQQQRDWATRSSTSSHNCQPFTILLAQICGKIRHLSLHCFGDLRIGLVKNVYIICGSQTFASCSFKTIFKAFKVFRKSPKIGDSEGSDALADLNAGKYWCILLSRS